MRLAMLVLLSFQESPIKYLQVTRTNYFPNVSDRGPEFFQDWNPTKKLRSRKQIGPHFGDESLYQIQSVQAGKASRIKL